MRRSPTLLQFTTGKNTRLKWPGWSPINPTNDYSPVYHPSLSTAYCSLSLSPQQSSFSSLQHKIQWVCVCSCVFLSLTVAPWGPGTPETPAGPLAPFCPGEPWGPTWPWTPLSPLDWKIVVWELMLALEKKSLNCLCVFTDVLSFGSKYSWFSNFTKVPLTMQPAIQTMKSQDKDSPKHDQAIGIIAKPAIQLSHVVNSIVQLRAPTCHKEESLLRVLYSFDFGMG